MWVYKRSEPNLYTVGFYDPAGKWHPDSDHSNPNYAADRAAWLNGSRTSTRQAEIIQAIASALNTEEEGEALIEVARNAGRAEMELAAIQFPRQD